MQRLEKPNLTKLYYIYKVRKKFWISEISQKQNIFLKNVLYKSHRILSGALRKLNVALNDIVKV